MKLTYVEFGAPYDTVDVIYVDGIRYQCGDDYHDKISSQFDGIIKGLEIAKVAHSVERYQVSAEFCPDVIEAVDSPPIMWPENDYFKNARRISCD